jgi:hypothetical protein
LQNGYACDGENTGSTGGGLKKAVVAVSNKKSGVINYSLFASLFLIPSRTELTIESTILNPMAVQKPSTWNPLTNLPVIKTITELITNRNSPNVYTVMGKERRIIMGFSEEFRKESTTATITAVKKLSTLMPKIQAVISTASVDMSVRSIKFIP